MGLCDICNTPGMGTSVSSVQMREAVFGKGFNPYSSNLATNPMAAIVSSEEAYQNWKSMVAQDTSDWNVCSKCMKALAPYMKSAPRATGVKTSTASVNPIVAAGAREEAEKKYAKTQKPEFMYCTKCGQANVKRARFCQECGTNLSGTSRLLDGQQAETAAGAVKAPQLRGVPKISRGFFLGSIAAGLGLSYLLDLLALLVAGQDVGVAMSLQEISFLPFLYGLIVWLVLIHRMWSYIQDGYARTTPGKAVGFLFIPLYNIYWIFQSVWGFSQDYNKFITRHRFNTSSLPENLFLAFSVIWLAAGVTALFIPAVSLFLGIVSYIILLRMVSAICNGLNSLQDIW